MSDLWMSGIKITLRKSSSQDRKVELLKKEVMHGMVFDGRPDDDTIYN